MIGEYLGSEFGIAQLETGFDEHFGAFTALLWAQALPPQDNASQRNRLHPALTILIVPLRIEPIFR
jgi:hypothetical protein